MPPKPRKQLPSGLPPSRPQPPKGPSPWETLIPQIKAALTQEDEDEKFWNIYIISGELKKILNTSVNPEGKTFFGQYTYPQLNNMLEGLGRIRDEYLDKLNREQKLFAEVNKGNGVNPIESAVIVSEKINLKKRAIDVFTEVFGGNELQKAGGYTKGPRKSRKSKRKNKSKRKKGTKRNRSKRNRTKRKRSKRR